VHNYSLVWGGSGESKLDADPCVQHAEELCRQFIERRVSGDFFAPYELVPERDEINRRLATMLREAGIPVILVDRDFVSYPFRSDFDLVGIDNVAGGYILAEHLLKLGCRRLHFVAYPLSAPSVNARIVGVKLLSGRVSNRTQNGFTSARWMTNPSSAASLLNVARTLLSVRTTTPLLYYCVRCVGMTSMCLKMSALSASTM
jgi:DNA-binding LacI/PurR family transcriptional regulator